LVVSGVMRVILTVMAQSLRVTAVTLLAW